MGVAPDRILMEGLSRGMNEISDRFDRGDLYLPQVMAASKVMDDVMAVLSPHLDGDGVSRYKGTVVMGSVEGDIHEIGKNICIAMLRGARFRVIDLGSDVSPEEFIEAARENSADFIGGSALMTTTLEAQRKLVQALRENGCVAVTLFGGAPCSQSWVDEIGGDAYSASGHEMVLLVNRMVENRPND
ncbi:MAG: cobalamin-dependent protein [archaeon]|nr:cobalamin-dependent protein [archaeon]